MQTQTQMRLLIQFKEEKELIVILVPMIIKTTQRMLKEMKT
jgi:hypothetical protein